MISPFRIVINSFFIVCHCHVVFSQLNNYKLDIPDRLIVEAYEAASTLDILAAVNSKIFFGYFSVCADGKGYGYGNTYPSLDGHQMSDALLWLGQTDVVKANWDYVKKFQKQNGALPLAILPGIAGKNIGPKNFEAPVDSNGGLFPTKNDSRRQGESRAMDFQFLLRLQLQLRHAVFPTLWSNNIGIEHSMSMVMSLNQCVATI